MDLVNQTYTPHPKYNCQTCGHPHSLHDSSKEGWGGCILNKEFAGIYGTSLEGCKCLKFIFPEKGEAE